MNNYIVTITFIEHKINPKNIIELIKRNVGMLVEKEDLKIIGNKMFWEFSSADFDVKTNVTEFINNMFVEGSIVGGKIDDR
ncbi:hypothetical protein [Clostridium perfringens]|uniref:hypothetical protein n=1 Tax=Clostridium perfringens TaxID=1502 RepID=UPI0018E4A160|nr:hypothetical protein [Clostridium perfringens]MBI6017014.1 hypothetical protein [Clostridium perfringens]MDM0527339.1 hypothetical protein [Clostridium perfringens]MDM0529208.1 hypothetical protein [Clostridium perfringens]MDM0553960.1 hypothetical protein [Clostridium perfringens]